MVRGRRCDNEKDNSWAHTINLFSFHERWLFGFSSVASRDIVGLLQDSLSAKLSTDWSLVLSHLDALVVAKY